MTRRYLNSRYAYHVAVGLSARCREQGHWRWAAHGAYLNYSGSAFADSPLLDSEHDFTLGASIAWMFWKSERTMKPKNTSPGGEFDTPLILGF